MANQLILVGIGASAGGLEALRLFVAKLPEKANMSYVVAQHMSPQHRSMMVDLLSRETTLPVYEVKDGIVSKPDTIYVCPPSSDVFIKNGRLRLRKPLSDIGAKPSVDYLFSSMAEDLGERTIGIVMSGTGADGSHGIRAINAAGGICIAQDPETAKYDSMPVAAIKAGVDLVLPPSDIAAQLLSVVVRPRVELTEQNDDEFPANPVESIVRHIYKRTRMDFSNYKESTITRQIERRMAVLQMPDLEQYVKVACDKPGELEALATNFLICVTSFFRDKDAFTAFKTVIRDTLTSKKPGDNIRIWVPGCATGEEAYSIAIILAEELGQDLDSYKVQVFATDVNSEATQFGRKGLYPETSIEHVDRRILQKYFVPRDRFFQVDRKIRDMVVFANQDLVQDPPFVRVDAITCRNLLIYFKTGLQEKVFNIFHYALNPGGILFLGKSESVGKNSNLFAEVDRKQKIFRKRDAQSHLAVSFSGALPLTAFSARRGTTQRPQDPPRDFGRDALVGAYVPPSVLVSADGGIAEIYGDVTPFMGLRSGKADFNLFSIIHPPLRTELRAIIQKVIRSGETTQTHPIAINVDGQERYFRSVVRAVESGQVREDRVLVSFEPGQKRQVTEIPLDAIDEGVETRIAELEHELTMTRESLQTVIEELETSNEELQSMNEEAQAANEELQASNEELETSNEELQATNEELTTVNDELSLRTHELAEALNDMEIIQNSSDLATIVVDGDLNIRRHNALSLEFFKMDPGSVNQNLASVPLLFDLEGLLPHIRAVSTDRQPFQAEFHRDRNVYELQAFPYNATKPVKMDGAVINIRDITEKAEAAQAIAESEQKFRAVIDNASSEIMLKDRDGRYLLVNKKFLENHRLKEEDAIGKSLAHLYNDEVAEPFRQLERKVLETGRSQSGELTAPAPLGDYPYGAVLSTKFPIRGNDGEIMAIGTINTDISQLRDAIQELETAKKEADSANKAKSQFLSSMSHELRTPLNAILGFGQLLQSASDKLSPGQQDAVGYILDGGHHLLNLINQVLDLARIEAGTVAMSAEPIPLPHIVDHCMTMAEALANDHDITIKSAINTEKTILLLVDPTRAKQVLLNLLSNAVKYNRPGGRVMLDAHERNDGLFYRVTVTDDGQGIPLDRQGEVFMPFHRLIDDPASVEGTGIGLAISKELAEQMGGAMGFTSTPGQGSVFWVDFPMALDAPEPPGADRYKEPEQEPASSRSLASFPDQTRVLVVEDNVANQTLIRAIFKRMPGIVYEIADTATTGLEICRRDPPSLVLMDIQLPDMSGIEATNLLKNDPRTRAIPVVAVSADALQSSIDEAMAAGFDGYVTKPFRLNELLSVLDRFLLSSTNKG